MIVVHFIRFPIGFVNLLLELHLSFSHHVSLFLAAMAVQVTEFITIRANHDVIFQFQSKHIVEQFH